MHFVRECPPDASQPPIPHKVLDISTACRFLLVAAALRVHRATGVHGGVPSVAVGEVTKSWTEHPLDRAGGFGVCMCSLVGCVDSPEK